MRTVLDGDAGRAQRVTDRVGTCEILGLARFGTFRKLFGNQLVERVMLGGIVASLFDAIYQLTEPPLRWLRQYIRPVPLGPIYFDVAYLVLYFVLVVIDFLI